MHPEAIKANLARVSSGRLAPEEFAAHFVRQLDPTKIPESLVLCPHELQQTIRDYISGFDCESAEFAEQYSYLRFYRVFTVHGLSTDEVMKLREGDARGMMAQVTTLHHYFKAHPEPP
jgi:hypothetical protein